VATQLDALIAALYVQIDDLFIELGVRQGPGRPPRLSDSELVCLAVAQVLLGCNSERRWLRFVGSRLGHLFPYLPGQSAYNKRLRAAARLLAHAIRHLAERTPSWCDQLRLLDSTPVPRGTSRETVKRSELRGWANYGYCASHTRYFWGLRLLTTPDGAVAAWALADPKLGDREVAQAMLENSPPRPGLFIVADKGYAGREFEDFVRELAAVLSDRIGAMSAHATASWAGSGSASSPSTTPSRANSGSKSTAAGPTWASSCGSPNACSPSPLASGTTGSSAPRTSAPWSLTTTEHSESFI
jgi:hypothetical protein